MGCEKLGREKLVERGVATCGSVFDLSGFLLGSGGLEVMFDLELVVAVEVGFCNLMGGGAASSESLSSIWSCSTGS
jgi:hypothetical protein